MEAVAGKDLDLKFARYQRQLLPYAYNIIGDMQEAEDVVQETLTSFFTKFNEHVENPKSYLTRSVINRSINSRKRLQVIKEKYRGHWLPTPLLTEDALSQQIDRSKILNYSLMVLLERLSPKERAVFILKESFDFQHDEVADSLGITVENSRQLFKRSRKKLEPEIGKSFAISKKSNSILKGLADAILNGDIENVKSMLAESVKSISDGGSKQRTAPNIVSGKHNVARFIKAMFGKYFVEGSTYSFIKVNHNPAIIFRKPDGVIYRCLILEISEGLVANTFIVVNPDKLRSMQT